MFVKDFGASSVLGAATVATPLDDLIFEVTTMMFHILTQKYNCPFALARSDLNSQ